METENDGRDRRRKSEDKTIKGGKMQVKEDRRARQSSNGWGWDGRLKIETGAEQRLTVDGE